MTHKLWHKVERTWKLSFKVSWRKFQPIIWLIADKLPETMRLCPKKRRKEIIIKLNLVIESVDEIQMSFDHISVYLFLTSLLLHQIHRPYRMRSRDALIRSKNVLVFKRFYKKNSETEPYLNHILASWKM